MADNLEIRVEQLTDAIRGLYNKPSLTPAEINNAFNTMLQRFENQTNLSSEKMLQIISNEIKRTAEERQGALQELLYGVEDSIKNAAAQISNPKFEMQISKLSTDLNSIYTKMNNQELQFQKFSQSIEALRTSGTAAEMAKLSNDFAAFSRGFDNITATLNKNFAEFLTQVQGYSQKEELNQIKYNLEEIIKNSSNVITAGEKIDALSNKLHNVSSKEDANYINEKITILTSFLSDLKAYLEKNDIENKEQFRLTITDIEMKLGALNFGTVDEIKADVKNLFNEIRNNASYSKNEIIAKFADVVDIINKSYGEIGEKFVTESSNVNNNLAQLTGEIQKVYTTVSDSVTGRTEEIKMQLQTLGEDYQNLKNVLVNLSSNTNFDEVANSIIKSNSETIELSHDFIQSQIGKIEEILNRQEESEKQHLVNAVELLKNEFGEVSNRICSLEADLGANDAAKAFEEPLNKIVECVETLKSSDALKQLSSMMGDVTKEINSSIAALKENFEKAQDGTSIQVLQQLNETVPRISDKLEIFRNHVVSENSANITELKQQFAQVVDTITSRVELITASIKDEFKTANSGDLDSIKVDLQNMSNHIMETVENINFNITKEFNDHKTNIDEVLSKINDYEDKFRDKLNSIESTFETLNQEGVDRINDAISLNQLQMSETLSALKSDIQAGILGINKNSKTNFELLDGKLEKLIKKAIEETSSKNPVTSLQEASQQELLAEIESKVERCNLQQIHNGKELLSEIQNLNSELSFKLESLNPNSEIPAGLIRGIDDKVQSILEANVDKEEYVKLIKSHMDLRMKEVIQKIAKIVSVFRPDTEKEEDAQKVAVSVKLDGLISQLEYLKDNIFAEIKEGFSQLDKKEEIIGDIYKNVGEVLSNTVYIKNNAPNEFRGILEEKLENLKNVEFLIEDLKNAIQNNQISTLERINSLNEDLNSSRTGLQDEMNSTRSAIIDDINSKLSNSNEKIESFNGRFDNLDNSLLEKFSVVNNLVNEKFNVVSDLVNEKFNHQYSVLDEIPKKLEENLVNTTGDISNRVSSIKDMICEEIKNSLSSKIDTNSINTSEKIINVISESSNESSQKLEGMLNQASERIASTVIDNVKNNLINIETYLDNLQKRRETSAAPAVDMSQTTDNISEKLDDLINQVLKKTEKTDDSYSMSDLEADLAKLRLSFEKSNKNIGADFQNIGGWLKNTNARLENLSNMVGMLSKKIENTEKLNLEEVKTRLVQNERDYVAPQKIEEALNGVYKKYKIQEMRLDELNEKISLILQKQSEGFDVKSFIDLFYDNTTQTKSLASRVDGIENKLNNISKNLEKIISYIDE